MRITPREERGIYYTLVSIDTMVSIGATSSVRLGLSNLGRTDSGESDRIIQHAERYPDSWAVPRAASNHYDRNQIGNGEWNHKLDCNEVNAASAGC
jgi:hypothetical protein